MQSLGRFEGQVRGHYPGGWKLQVVTVATESEVTACACLKGDSQKGGAGLSPEFPLVTHNLFLGLRPCPGAAEGAHS